MKSQHIIITIIGVDVVVLLCAYLWYLLIFSSGWNNIELANDWAFVYLLAFAADFFI
jgi:flagellar basal body-associated protein FliL